jgi:hypothetical protein
MRSRAAAVVVLLVASCGGAPARRDPVPASPPPDGGAGDVDTAAPSDGRAPQPAVDAPATPPQPTDAAPAREDAGATAADAVRKADAAPTRPDAATKDGGAVPPADLSTLPKCPGAGMAIDKTCDAYCACWFSLCWTQPMYAEVFATAADCRAACEKLTPGELACKVYRVTDRPLEVHCGQAIPGNKCP